MILRKHLVETLKKVYSEKQNPSRTLISPPRQIQPHPNRHLNDLLSSTVDGMRTKTGQNFSLSRGRVWLICLTWRAIRGTVHPLSYGTRWETLNMMFSQGHFRENWDTPEISFMSGGQTPLFNLTQFSDLSADSFEELHSDLAIAKRLPALWRLGPCKFLEPSCSSPANTSCTHGKAYSRTPIGKRDLSPQTIRQWTHRLERRPNSSRKTMKFRSVCSWSCRNQPFLYQGRSLREKSNVLHSLQSLYHPLDRTWRHSTQRAELCISTLEKNRQDNPFVIIWRFITFLTFERHLNDPPLHVILKLGRHTQSWPYEPQDFL